MKLTNTVISIFAVIISLRRAELTASFLARCDYIPSSFDEYRHFVPVEPRGLFMTPRKWPKSPKMMSLKSADGANFRVPSCRNVFMVCVRTVSVCSTSCELPNREESRHSRYSFIMSFSSQNGRKSDFTLKTSIFRYFTESYL